MARRSIAGCRSLVTGASGGIGRAIALELARQGSSVVLVARRADALQKLAGEIHTAGVHAEIVVGDVTDAAVRRAALDRAREALGGLDILVNNAGRGAMGRFAEASPERLREVFELNFFTAAELIREAVPLLQRGNRPIVVNIGSILGHCATPRNSEYCASKFALRGLTESLRPELAKLGIDTLLVSPGTTESDFYQHVLNPAEKPPWRQQKPVSAEKVARAVVRAIRLGKRETIPSTTGRVFVWLNRLLPSLVDRLMRRYG
ncbi:MAG: SDR family NAD(P)-dependent oxidoreductase [Pirellulales bacterium]